MDIGCELSCDEVPKLIFPDPAHDEDRHRDSGPSDLEAFLHHRDREDRSTLDLEPHRDRPRAVAVSVRLHDRHGPAAVRQRALDRPEVPGERVEIHDGARRPERTSEFYGSRSSEIIARSEKRVYSPDQPRVKRSVGPLRCLAMMTSQTFFCSVSLS